MIEGREQLLSHNALRLIEAQTAIEQIEPGDHVGVPQETKARLLRELIDLRNACITAPPPDQI